MLIKKALKITAISLISVIVLSCIFYLTVFLFTVFDFHNEYVLCGFLGILHSVIIVLSEKKIAGRVMISEKIYLFSATILPALAYYAVSFSVYAISAPTSIFDTAFGEVRLYLIFMSISLSVSCIAVCLLNLLIRFANLCIKH